jgi:hypothetical protein
MKGLVSKRVVIAVVGPLPLPARYNAEQAQYLEGTPQQKRRFLPRFF